MASGLFVQDFAVVMLTAGVLGWLCQRAGLSVVVGYLTAGLVVGPGSLGWVSDAGSVRALADVGLVFLMFSIGLGLSLRRLRRLGPGPVAAAFLGAAFTFALSRAFGSMQGWTEQQSVVLGAMLVVSSSAVIGKVIAEAGGAHTRASQLALGVTVLEDLVAIVALTLLGSYLGITGAAADASVLRSVGGFGIFVLLLGLASLLLVPKVLRWLGVRASPEVQTVLLVALLLGIGLFAVKAGYSLALGAFLLGAVVAETPERGHVSRVFEGLRDVFSAVFFVTIGMQLDMGGLVESLPLILKLGVFTILARWLATSAGLLLTGNSLRDSVQSGLMLTPIGEFSFIIVQVGVAAAVVPPEAYPTAVGVALFTTLVSPVAIRRSEAIGAWIVAREPRVLAAAISAYHDLLVRLRTVGQASLVWKLGRRRFVQIGVEMLALTGLILGARPAERWLSDWAAGGGMETRWVSLLVWTGVGLVLLPGLVAVWRNGSALAMILAEIGAQGARRKELVKRIVEISLRVALGISLVAWLLVFLPVRQAFGLLLVTCLLLAVVVAFSWRRLVFLHSKLEIELEDALEAPAPPGTSLPPWLQHHRQDWRLNIADFSVPDGAACAGRTLQSLDLRARTGCSIVGINRQGYVLGNPGPEAMLYPLDKLLLLGTAAQIAEARRFLAEPRPKGDSPTEEIFEDVAMSVLVVPDSTPWDGKRLAELVPPPGGKVQVVGLRRNGRPRLNPGGDQDLKAGDELLVLGAPEKVHAYECWLQGRESAARRG